MSSATSSNSLRLQHYTSVQKAITKQNLERNICTTKNCMRSTVYSTPYSKMLTTMIDGIATRVQMSLNAFPSRNGISIQSPRNIIEWRPNLDFSTMKLTFGAYVQLYEKTTNTQKARSVGAIAMYPSNERGGYYFMSLRTGKRLHGFIWNEVPITDEVISRVEQLGEEDGQLMMMDRPIFE